MPDQDKIPVPRPDEAKPVVWTPEDASRFLATAIREAEGPLREELKKRPITATWLGVIIGVFVLGTASIALILSSQVEKMESRAENAGRQREELLTEKAQLQAKSSTLEERLSMASEEITTLKGSSEALQSARSDLAKFRRQNELLRSQISGLEMEKVALARQLEAVKALAIDDAFPDESGEAVGTDPFGSKGEGAGPETGGEEAVLVIEEISVAPEVVSEVLTPEEMDGIAPPSIGSTAGATETITEPAADLRPTDAAAIRPVEPVAEPVVEPVVEPVAEPVVETIVEPVAEPVVETIPEPAAEAETEAVDVVESVAAESAGEPAAQPVVEPFQAASEAYGEQLAQEEAVEAIEIETVETVETETAAEVEPVAEAAPETAVESSEETPAAETAEETTVEETPATETTGDGTAAESSPEENAEEITEQN